MLWQIATQMITVTSFPLPTPSFHDLWPEMPQSLEVADTLMGIIFSSGLQHGALTPEREMPRSMGRSEQMSVEESFAHSQSHGSRLQKLNLPEMRQNLVPRASLPTDRFGCCRSRGLICCQKKRQ